jgi:CDP-diacylglycerol--glycerol-3-phosphate 3-phosphatidyltransferase
MAMSMSRTNARWALPNLLTYGRVVAVPIVVGLMFWPEEHWMRWTALGIYAVAAITDFFDGYLARVLSQQSALGRMLDPIADKLLVSACLMMLVANRDIAGFSIWAAMVILCREILVSGMREFLAELHVGLPVSTVAKWKTTVQLLSLGFLIVGPAGEKVLPGNIMIGTTLLWMAAVLTLYTGWDYMRAGMKYVED